MLPISIFLIPYGLFLLLFMFFSFVHIYHLIHFGRATGFTGFLMTFIFMAVTVLVFYATYTYATPIDWSERVRLIPEFEAPSFEVEP